MYVDAEAARAGPSDAQGQTFVLADDNALGTGRGACAVIDGPPEAARRAADLLEQALRTRLSASIKRVQFSDEELAQLLDSVTAGDAGVGVAALVWFDRQALAGIRGQGCVYAFAGTAAERIDGFGASRSVVQEFTLKSNAEFVVLSENAAHHLAEYEFHSSLGQGMPLLDIAEWFATLAASRAHGPAATVFVRTERVSKTAMLSEASGIPGRRRFLMTAAVAVITAVALLGAGAWALLGTSASSAPPAVPPTVSSASAPSDLRVADVAPDHATLVWTRTPGATGYVIRTGQKTYQSTEPRLALTAGLRAGHTYPWQVRARFGNQLGPASPRAVLHVPLRSMPALIATSPRGTYAAPRSGRVGFCLQTQPVGQRIELTITGRGTPLHTAFTAHQGQSGKQRLCHTVALRSNASYAWRAVASAAGYDTAQTPWIHFVDRAPAAPARRKLTATPRPQPTPPPGPVVAPPVQSVPQPVATTAPVFVAPTQAPVYVPPTAAPAPAPVYQAPQATAAPTPAVLTCSNPPNCS
jgi:hypothetical protein